MRLHCAMTAALCFACVGPVEDLKGGVPAQPEPPAPAPKVPDPPIVIPQPSDCATWIQDRRAENLDEIDRLGLLLSHTTVEGRIDVPQAIEHGFRALLHIDRVHSGPAFLAGGQYWLEFDSEEVSHFTFPGAFILGLDGNPYPTRGDGDGIGRVQKRAIISAARRETFADLLGYREDRAPMVAVVQIVQQDEQRTEFEVVEAIAGDFPVRFSANWSQRAYQAPFPPVSATLYIASLSDVQYHESAAVHLASLVDFREKTPQSTAIVEAARAAPRTGIDFATALASAEVYRDSWRFHRAPIVVATTVTGLAAECCTGAGGEYVAHEVEAVLEGDDADRRFMRGGHAYYSDERCGDQAILALQTLGDAPPPPSNAFTCEAFSAGLITGMPVAAVRIELPDDPANRAQVHRWLDAAAPLYRLHGLDAHAPALGPSSNAPWSAPLNVRDAMLSRTRLALIDIVDVEQRSGGYEVTIDTNFHAQRYDHLPLHRVKIAFECGDPRLREPGSRWLVPLVFDDMQGDPITAVAEGKVFIVPGVALPNLQYIERIVSALDQAARR